MSAPTAGDLHATQYKKTELITSDITQIFDHFRKTFDIRGVYVAAVKVKDPNDESKGWVTETAAFVSQMTIARP